jgi:hypothetical protein
MPRNAANSAPLARDADSPKETCGEAIRRRCRHGRLRQPGPLRTGPYRPWPCPSQLHRRDCL